jgi:hypothetical protein
MAGPELHLLGMAELEKPGEQMRRDTAGLRPDPVVKIISVHETYRGPPPDTTPIPPTASNIAYLE